MDVGREMSRERGGGGIGRFGWCGGGCRQGFGRRDGGRGGGGRRWGD